MTRPFVSIQPPRFPSWAVGLFASAEQADSILGDFHEEFLRVGSKSGVAVARRWYWRQSSRTIAHLALGGLGAAPWSTAVALIGGFLLLRFVHGLPDKLLSALTDRYLMYWSTHFHAYLWVLRGMWIEYLMGSLLTGCIVAVAAKGREMVATMTLSLILCAMAVASFAWIVATTGDVSFLWKLPVQFADPLAVVLGGVIVRTRRSAATILRLV
jgi:hypothetical protein